MKNLFTKKKTAFTLAEVLITLGIIGVVAALTLPTLVTNYQKMVLKNQFKKAYTILENAHSSARVKFGTVPGCYYGIGVPDNYDDCAEYSKLFLNELQVAQDCGYNAMSKGCVPEYKGNDELAMIAHPEYSEEDVASAIRGCTNLKKSQLLYYPAYILNDGVIIMPGLNSARLSVNTIVDINGKKGPNKWGHDVFFFYTKFNGKNFLAIGSGSIGCMPLEEGGKSTDFMIKNMHQ